MTKTMRTITIEQGSSEFLRAVYTADALLDQQTVEMSMDGKATWLAAEWVGEPAFTRTCRVGPIDFSAMEPGTRFPVHVRLTDSPERPILKAYVVQIV